MYVDNTDPPVMLKLPAVYKWTILFWLAASYIGCAIIYSILNLFPSNMNGAAYKPYQLAWAIPVVCAIVAIAVLTPFCIKWWNAYKDKKAKKGA